MRHILSLTAGLILFCAPATAQNKTDANLQIMLRAARSLAFVLPENRPYMLEKQETITAEVALVFGYMDNRAACDQIADALSSSGRLGTFKCHPVY